MDKNKKELALISNTLKAFAQHLVVLNEGNNLVLGGSNALMLHGLNLERSPEDVDIIMYNPTPKQLDYIESIKHLNTLDEKSDYGVTNVLKLRARRGLTTYTLDILTVFELLPEHLLVYEKENVKIKVQDIATVIEAKGNYGRLKDVKDLLALKNLNFNYNLTFNLIK